MSVEKDSARESGDNHKNPRRVKMRILIMSGGLLAAALVHTSSTPAAAGPWCYLNENEHCDQVSFESCHFGTLGNGGYCYTNAGYRWHGGARAHARAFVTVSTSPRWGYTDHYAY